MADPLITRFYRHLWIAAISSCLAACGGGGSSSTAGATLPQATPSPIPTRTPLAVPVVAGALLPAAGSLYFGAYVNSTGLVGGNTPESTAAFEQQIGRPLALHMQYEQFTANFSGRNLQDDFANWRVPVVSWNCGAPNAQIASGSYDPTIFLKATEAKNFGWPVFVRFFWDPNVSSGPSGRSACYDPLTDNADRSFSATEFIAAWLHVRKIFAEVGATNVVWLWTINTQSSVANPLAYYPGSGAVDWVGLDDYQTTTSDFSASFSSTYATLATLDKPIMVAELGVPAATQPGFFALAAQRITTQFPLVRALLYYDSISYAANSNLDWRLTQSAFPPFTSFANDARMAARYAH